MIPKEFLKSHRQFADSDPQVMPLYLESANAVGAAHESTCLVAQKFILFFQFLLQLAYHLKLLESLRWATSENDESPDLEETRCWTSVASGARDWLSSSSE